jgi:D-alanyl-D-alanine carboxypeptidase/D-alanyl-D-alanine-endopeptidase (penicillin-binding protein 4)
MRFSTFRRSLLAGAALALTATALTAAGTPGTGPIGTGTALAGAAAPGDAALSAALDAVLAKPDFQHATVGMQVLDAATGEVIYTRGTGQRVIPASNEKLLTSAAALEYLKPTYTFHTTASYTGTKSGKAVRGDIVLKGTGDPTLTHARIDAIAKQVAAKGITSFSGSLIADDSAFDRTQLGLDWSWEDEAYAYGAPISALTAAANDNYDTGAVSVTARPGTAKGKAAAVTLMPRNSYVTIRNTAVTGAAGSTDTVTAIRRHGTNIVVVSGSMPLGGGSTDLTSVQEPTLFAAAAFRDALTRHKVKVTGATVIKATPAGAKQLYDLPSAPLSELLPKFLKLSNNGHAELLVKAMGRQATGGTGTWANGLAQLRTTLGGLGVSTAHLVVGDGSGLTRRDLVTAQQVAALLRAAQARPWFAAWYAALPIAGAPGLTGGTLANRFPTGKAKNNLHAKTGSMTGVNALSGYVDDATGRRLIFSFVSNNATVSVTARLDEAAEILASSGSVSALSARVRLPDVKPVYNREGNEVECSWMQAC